MSSPSSTSISFDYSAETDYAKGLEVPIGSQVMIRDATYLVKSSQDIVFQRYTDYPLTGTSICSFDLTKGYHPDELIGMKILVKDLSNFRLAGWDISIHQDTETKKEHLVFKCK